MIMEDVDGEAGERAVPESTPIPVNGSEPLTVDQALLLWSTCPEWLATAFENVLVRQDALANLIVGTEMRALELAVYGLADRIQKVELALIETETVMTRAKDST